MTQSGHMFDSAFQFADWIQSIGHGEFKSLINISPPRSESRRRPCEI